MTGTPIPAGVLTVDEERTGTGVFLASHAIRFADGTVLARVTPEVRARLLAGPPRPDGVPNEAVPVNMWIGHDQGDASAQVWLGDGTPTDFLADVIWFRDVGVPVPPYQPDPDPEALLVEKITADWTHPDPADSPTDHVKHYRTCNCLADSAECCRASCSCHAAPAAAGERTGPLDGYPHLALLETRERVREVAAITDDELPLREITALTKLVDACRAAVAEWDAQPEPAETIADIVAEMRTDADPAESFGFPDDATSLREMADRIEAAASGVPQGDANG